MSGYLDRVSSAGQTLAELLTKDFPDEADPPNDNYAFSDYQAFLANSPRRLISIICADYGDFDASGEDYYELFDREQASYEKIFADSIAAATAHFGQASYIANHTDGLFDDELFNFDHVKIAYWKQGDRHAVIHLADQTGDGELQFSVSALVVPAK
jgi:hypothetical protein